MACPEEVFADARPSLEQASARLALGVRLALGKPYRWGAAGPAAFDCSGLVQWLYGLAGLRLPRVALDQGRGGKRVTDCLKAGDVLLFRSKDSPSGWHVGLYLARGVFVHASGGRRGVCLSKLETSRYRANFVTARRYLA